MTAEKDSSSLSPRRLTTADAAAGVRLSTQAGWNQVEHDWTVMIEAGHGICLVDPSDGLIATSVLLPFLPRVDWTCMVLVDTSWRGRGIGTRLMRLIVELSPNPVIGLDATDVGLPLYERLGFAASERITRYRLPRRIELVSTDLNQPILTASRTVYRETLIRFARETNEDRRALLESLTLETGTAFAVRNEKTVAVGSIRTGRTSTQVGPIYAVDIESAADILRSIVASRSESLIIDSRDRHSGFVTHLLQLGFEPTRRFTRMFRGGMPPSNPFEFATAGPDFG